VIAGSATLTAMSSGAGDAQSPTMPSFAIGDVIPSAAEDLLFSMFPGSKGRRSDRCGRCCHYSKRVGGLAGKLQGQKCLGNGSGSVAIKCCGKQVCQRKMSVAAAGRFKRQVMVSALDDVLLELFEFDAPTAPANIVGRVEREP